MGLSQRKPNDMIHWDTCWMLKSGITTDTVSSSQVSASPSTEQSRGLRAASTCYVLSLILYYFILIHY